MKIKKCTAMKEGVYVYKLENLSKEFCGKDDTVVAVINQHWSDA